MFDPHYQLGLDTALLKRRDLVRFFDIDGVLSVYGYGSDGINACSDEAIDAFMETQELYRYAAAPAFIQDYIRRYTDPARNYVVSQSGNEAQDRQKRAFLRRCYPGAFPEPHILFTRSNVKADAVRQVLHTMPRGLQTPHLLIDDSAGVLDQLQTAGIAAVHVSSLLLLAELREDTAACSSAAEGQPL